KISAFKSGIWQVQRFRASDRYIAYVDANHGSCFVISCLGQVAFTTTQFKNGFVPDERLQAPAQDFIPELRVGNMPGVRSCVIEIEIGGRSHCWFPHCAWLENKSSWRSPKTDYLCRAGAIPALRAFPLGQRLLHFHPFAPSRFETIRIFRCPGLGV